MIETFRRSRSPSRTVRNQFQSERSRSIPRRSTTLATFARPGSLRVPETGSPPSRYSTTSIRVSGTTTSLKPVSGRPSISTRKLKFRYGASSGIALHLPGDIGELAVDREVVMDRGLVRPAGCVAVPAPDGDLRRLAPSEVRRARVEQRADLLPGREELEVPEERELGEISRPTEAPKRRLEVERHPEGGSVADVRDREEEQPVVEDDVQQHLGTAFGLPHVVVDMIGHLRHQLSLRVRRSPRSDKTPDVRRPARSPAPAGARRAAPCGAAGVSCRSARPWHGSPRRSGRARPACR